MDIFVALIGFAGYLLPIPSLIWGWVRWLSSKPRFPSPAWRYAVAFLGLAIASAIGLSVLFVASHCNGLPEGPIKYSFALASSRFGFAASAFAGFTASRGDLVSGDKRLPKCTPMFGYASRVSLSKCDGQSTRQTY
jgi:hypothetical protein